jgi:hypothetical protein
MNRTHSRRWQVLHFKHRRQSSAPHSEKKGVGREARAYNLKSSSQRRSKIKAGHIFKGDHEVETVVTLWLMAQGTAYYC